MDLIITKWLLVYVLEHKKSFTSSIFFHLQCISEVGGTKFWVLESESGIMSKPKRIRYWIRDSEKKLNETKSETEAQYICFIDIYQNWFIKIYF